MDILNKIKKLCSQATERKRKKSVFLAFASHNHLENIEMYQYFPIFQICYENKVRVAIDIVQRLQVNEDTEVKLLHDKENFSHACTSCSQFDFDETKSAPTMRPMTNGTCPHRKTFALSGTFVCASHVQAGHFRTSRDTGFAGGVWPDFVEVGRFRNVQ